jgi:hypothetical protein
MEVKSKMNNQEEIKGFKIHALVTVFVLVLLITVNLIVVPEFLWFLFPLFGMSIGLAVHYYFGVHLSSSIS